MSDERPVAPYGAWPSPIEPELLARAAIGLGEVRIDGDTVWWLEGRPAEAGRVAAVRLDPGGEPADAVPADCSVRTLAHEYGGGSWYVRDGVLWFSNFADQRLYRQGPDGELVAITPEPARPRSDRYADPEVTPDGRWLYCVRERHPETGEAANTIVRLPADAAEPQEPVEVAGGHDFCSDPRVSPDGRRLAWLTWDHPNMPWDGTELHVADIADDGSLGNERVLMGGVRGVSGGAGHPAVTESVFQPSWSPDGVLHAVGDRTGWWNLYRFDGDEPVALHEAELEFGVPQWIFAQSTYAFLADGRIACLVAGSGLTRVHLLHPDGRLDEAGLGWTAVGVASIRSNGRVVVLTAGSGTQPNSVVRWDTVSGEQQVLRRAFDFELDPGLASVAEPITFPTPDGAEAHALFHPPRNPAVRAPAGELPPLLVFVHGGPTSAASAGLTVGVQFWTSRGFGVCNVNYRGSTGFGRAYRDALKGRWGVADVTDCVAAARHLAETGRVDGTRLAIRGGSAGGFTTLAALAFDDVFAAGTSHFGVADLGLLVEETHKFESRYLDQLIGPWPEDEATYRERSPLYHADRISRPVLLLQGLEDKVVPPSQAEAMVEALAAQGTPHAYVAFEGEDHGWRKAETIVRAVELELSFYGQVFGFDPAGDPEQVELVQP